MSPFPPANYFLHLGIAYRETGYYDEAIAEYKRCLKLGPNNIMAHRSLSIAYALAGRHEEAREAWSEVLKIDPKTSYKKYDKKCPFPPENCERSKVAMQKAGIKYE